jgi:hypothetical protein
MTTTCAGAANATLLSFPQNVGVSGTAYEVERYVKDIEELLLARTMTIGRHYLETRKSLAEAYKSSAVGNWDGYGAKPIDPGSCLKAIRFSTLLPMNIPIPDISIDTDGEARFEWYRGPRQVFSVAVRNDGQLAYAGLFGANKAYGAEYLGDELPNTLLDNIRRVYA